MNSLYRQAYVTSVGFTKFITGIHYLIELLAFEHVVEPFDIESLQPYVPNKELLMILTSKSLTLSATTYFRSSLIEVLQDIINELQRRQNPISDSENTKKELERLYTLLEEADDQEEVIIKLEHTLKDAMNENDFEKVKELHLKLEEVKLKDRFYIQNKIDELESQPTLPSNDELQSTSIQNKALIGLTQLIDTLDTKESNKTLRNRFRKWLVDNGYIVEVHDGKSKLYKLTQKGEQVGIVTKEYNNRDIKTTAIFMEYSVFLTLLNTSEILI
jgi:predicted transcriptional regulator